MNEFSLDISDRQSRLVVEQPRLRQAVLRVLTEEGVRSATISLALVEDAEIQRINREFLGHDYPTDVISFLLDDEESGNRGQETGVRSQESESGSQEAESRSLDVEGVVSAMPVPRPSFPLLQPFLEGELIVSTETALREAAAHGWSPQDEVLLYVVHGLLHLCGYDDLTDEARPAMRLREQEILAGWHLVPTGLEV